LEEKMKAIEAENAELKTQLKIGREAIAREEIEKNKFVDKISNLLKANSSEAQIGELIQEFGDRYADYGKDRQAAVGYHLAQVERLLLPTQVTRMCLWSLQQPDSFYDDPEPLPAIDGQELPASSTVDIGGSLWQLLSKELELSREQMSQIKGCRAKVRERGDEVKITVQMLNQLKKRVQNKNNNLDSEMAGIQGILTPKQSAKFILWVSNNPACIHMLNQIWRTEGVGLAKAPKISSQPPDSAYVRSSAALKQEESIATKTEKE